LLEPHASSAFTAHRILADEFYSSPVERLDNLRERLNHPSHITCARFHALDGWQRDPCHLRELALVNAKEGTGSTDLCGSYQ
jgi:hypothetical protein